MVVLPGKEGVDLAARRQQDVTQCTQLIQGCGYLCNRILSEPEPRDQTTGRLSQGSKLKETKWTGDRKLCNSSRDLLS